jgi:hypothetical protein
MSTAWRDIGRISLSSMLSNIANGGVLQLLGLIFFNLAPDRHWLFDDEFSIAKRLSTT